MPKRFGAAQVRRGYLAMSLAGLGLGLLAGPAVALPLISEVFYDAVGSDNGRTFVELYGVPGTDLTGFVLEGVNGSGGAVGPSLALSGFIDVDGLFVIADDMGDGTSHVSGADAIANFDFQNGPDSIRLRFGGTEIDAVGYGSFGVGDVFAGEGTPAPDVPAGSSLARPFANVDTGDNATDFVESTPTPGVAAVMVPEPATAGMLALGLVGLAWVGRERASRRRRSV